jgi:hypothetical protein
MASLNNVSVVSARSAASGAGTGVVGGRRFGHQRLARAIQAIHPLAKQPRMLLLPL